MHDEPQRPGSGLRTRLGVLIRRWLRWTDRPPVVHSRHYGIRIPAGTMDPQRADSILAFLVSEGLVRSRSIHRPHPASWRSLGSLHTDAYLDSLQAPDGLLPIVGCELLHDEQDRFLDAQRCIAGGTVLAARLAARHRRVIQLGGGLHHATAGRGQGFCAFNDVALAVRDRRAAGFEGRILILDLDLHDGEGTRAIFADDASVFTLSIHNRDLPPTARVASLSLALGSAVDDRTYLDAVESTLPGVVRDFAPELVFYLAGCDPAVDDAIGDWSIGAEALLRRDRFVTRLIDNAAGAPPLVVLLAGGYGPDAWRYSARFLSWLLGGPGSPEPPDSSALKQSRYRSIARGFYEAEMTAEPGASDDWTLTEDDLMPQSRPTRFLDYYSRHGVELILERSGILELLRARGYDRPELLLDLDPGGTHTLKVVDRLHGSSLLIELRVHRDRRSWPGSELLFVDWLLLQDPRATFSVDRPQLSGQERPGLGILGRVTRQLLHFCEQLGLDGVCFVPQHYHVAARASRRFQFIDPAIEGRFRSLRAALQHLPLAEAARTLEDGCVRDARGEAVAWIPASMVRPGRDAFERKLRDPDRLAQVESARKAAKFEIVLNIPGNSDM